MYYRSCHRQNYQNYERESTKIGQKIRHLKNQKVNFQVFRQIQDSQFLSLVLIQQLRGPSEPNFIHFDHLSTPFERIILGILHTILPTRCGLRIGFT